MGDHSATTPKRRTVTHREPEPMVLAEAFSRAQWLADCTQRRVLGIAGLPGSGKSTLAQRVVDKVGTRASLVAMDGFHLAQSELVRLGRAERKGAPDTFDVAGYIGLLRRLRARPYESVYAPVFRRELEEPIAAAVEVATTATLVVTEGNYLLGQVGAWASIRGLLDEVWYVDTPDETRIPWLIERHVRHGRSPEAARAWVMRSDECNAAVVRLTRRLADRTIPYGIGE
jgi:pantothenate kinase